MRAAQSPPSSAPGGGWYRCAVRSKEAAADSRAGWLPALLPADARSFRVSDPILADALTNAGGEIVEERPDVEIASGGDLSGDAATVIISADAAQAEGGSLLRRAPRRAAGFLQARLHGRSARRLLARHGYPHTSAVMWDINQVVYLPEIKDRRRERPLAELLPQRVIVVGRRTHAGQTALEAAVEAAAQAGGSPLVHGWPLARESGVIAVADGGVINVAIGPGRRKIEDQRLALHALEHAPPVVADRLPRTIAYGRVGLADWSLETRLRGAPAARELPAELLDEVVGFLAALHEVGDPAAPRRSVAEDAHVLARVCVKPGNADRLRALGATLERDLAEVPRGFGHGDFWTRNLMVEEATLIGVIDWDGAGPGRLPLLDLLHLLLSARRDRTRQYVGEAMVDYLLPWARAGGDETVRSYMDQIGVGLDRTRLEELVIAYWLDRMALEVRTFSDRADRPFWIRNNVECVVEALSERALPV